MISDNVIQAYPLCGMVTRAQNLLFVTEQTNDNRYFMSLITPEGSFKILEFDSIKITTDMTAKFISATSGLMIDVLTYLETQIGSIISA